MYKKIVTDNIIVIIIGLILIIIIVFLAYINYQNRQATKEFLKERAQKVNPTPTIIPTPFKIIIITPTPAPVNRIETVYDTDILNTVVEKVDNRQAVSQSDQTAKDKTLKLLPPGQQSGILYQSDNVIIDYTFGKSDWFQAEILTTDIARAKEETVTWFLNQGFSQNFICNYPVDFYLSSDVKEELMNNNAYGVFSSLAPGCQ